MGNTCTCINEIDQDKEEFKTKSNSERQIKKPTFKDEEATKRISHAHQNQAYGQNNRKEVGPVESVMREDVDNNNGQAMVVIDEEDVILNPLIKVVYIVYDNNMV